MADFGIAHFGSSELTSTGIVMGTSRYLLPEQARGEPTDERSDLYSAGVVLFEMLAGRLPFEGDNDLAIAMQHANDPVPSPATFAPDLPAALDAIVARALRKDPAERFQTAAEFFTVLAALDPGRGRRSRPRRRRCHLRHGRGSGRGRGSNRDRSGDRCDPGRGLPRRGGRAQRGRTGRRF